MALPSEFMFTNENGTYKATLVKKEDAAVAASATSRCIICDRALGADAFYTTDPVIFQVHAGCAVKNAKQLFITRSDSSYSDCIYQPHPYPPPPQQQQQHQRGLENRTGHRYPPYTFPQNPFGHYYPPYPYLHPPLPHPHPHYYAHYCYHYPPPPPQQPHHPHGLENPMNHYYPHGYGPYPYPSHLPPQQQHPPYPYPHHPPPQQQQQHSQGLLSSLTQALMFAFSGNLLDAMFQNISF